MTAKWWRNEAVWLYNSRAMAPKPKRQATVAVQTLRAGVNGNGDGVDALYDSDEDIIITGTAAVAAARLRRLERGLLP